MHSCSCPVEKQGNLNEAFFVKRELGPRDITLERNQWPASLPGFKETCIEVTTPLAVNMSPTLPVRQAGIPVFCPYRWKLDEWVHKH